MDFCFTPTAVRETGEGHRFRIKQLMIRSPRPADISHLVDRTYDYSSRRELRWHLAERFAVAPRTVTLTAA